MRGRQRRRGDRLRHVHHRLRMQRAGARPERRHGALPEAGAAAGGGDHQRAAHAEALRLLGKARERAVGEDDALGRQVVDERSNHGGDRE